MTSRRELAVILMGKEAGTLSLGPQTRLSFTYKPGWIAPPVSLSMPTATPSHGHDVCAAFIWGLLPDSEAVLESWARQFQVSARNPFALIENMGEECAGAVQFAVPARALYLTSDMPRQKTRWLTERDVAGILRGVRQGISTGRAASDAGQFSLAGAQPKTALLKSNGRWGVPSGRTPTTHILKPPTADFDGYAENEHFCLILARIAGLPAANSSVMRFDDEPAIVVERFDRATPAAEEPSADPVILRIHQEDMCQALARLPTSKYQNEGGPSPEEIISLLRYHSHQPVEDTNQFVRALIFNWLIAGTDAHAKNYGVLHGAGGRVRLAPLYDISSALPYDRIDLQAAKLAMKIGGVYRLRDIGPRQWRKFAEANRLEPDQILKMVSVMAKALPNQAEAARRHLSKEGLTHPVVERLTQGVIDRTTRCRRELVAAGANHEP